MHTHMGRIIDPIERKFKYQRIRNAGYHFSIARRLRDWTDNHIDLFMRSNPVNKLEVE